MSTVAEDPELVKFLAEAAYYIRATQIMFASLYAVALWDWLTSLKEEYRLIWKTKWSVIKVLYLLSRYWVIIVMPYVLWVFIESHSLAMCQKLFRSPVALAMWNQIWSEGILLVRTYAFLGNKLPVLVVLVTMLCGVVGFQLWIDITQMALLPFLDPTGGPCFPTTLTPNSPVIMLFFVAPLIFDTFVTCLTMHRAYVLRLQGGGRSGGLLQTFVQEGVFYFIAISAANLCNAIFYWQPNKTKSALLIPMSVIFPNIVACRMILGLRARGVRHTSEHNPSTHAQQYSHTARKFSTANKLGPGTHGAPINISKGAPSTKDGGVITNMDFNHELTTFQGTQVVRGDSDSMVGRDVKTIPYEVEELDHSRGRNGIRVDIESTRYYEDKSDGEEDKKGRSFMP